MEHLLLGTSPLHSNSEDHTAITCYSSYTHFIHHYLHVHTHRDNQVPSMFELTQLVLILLLAYETLQMLRRRSCTVSQLPLYSGRPSNIPRTGQIASACSKAHKRKRLTNNSDGDEGSNPKLRRTSKYHSSSCLPCALWRQSGSDNNLIQLILLSIHDMPAKMPFQFHSMLHLMVSILIW